MKIWKLRLPNDDFKHNAVVVLFVPESAKLIRVGEDLVKHTCVWFEVQETPYIGDDDMEDQPKKAWPFLIAKTGQEIIVPPTFKLGDYLSYRNEWNLGNIWHIYFLEAANG